MKNLSETHQQTQQKVPDVQFTFTELIRRSKCLFCAVAKQITNSFAFKLEPVDEAGMCTTARARSKGKNIDRFQSELPTVILARLSATLS
jgi:hypothetical protein